MLNENIVREIAEKHLSEDMFLVGIKVLPGNEIEITVDSDTSVGIDDCAALSRAMNADIEAITDDYALMVASAGIGQPLKVFRQYAKLIGKPVEVVLKNGVKVLAVLRGATPEAVTLAYEEKVAVEGKKKKETREVVKEYRLDEIKSTAEHLDYK
ncbi:MAG: ribosome assembly cofactor RimP [Rikenellaceae bacterium]|nr:ribosome assembly cofactor RimP [Rikenellaceae bacterium]